MSADDLENQLVIAELDRPKQQGHQLFLLVRAQLLVEIASAPQRVPNDIQPVWRLWKQCWEPTSELPLAATA